ncbi:SNF2 family N-terminal domain-containing protein [Xylariomycetidae sp. FL0641]|nr:SNF2 family N-terminal domain-containing protein [Xylariomycetidae sp. FL0641]
MASLTLPDNHLPIQSLVDKVVRAGKVLDAIEGTDTHSLAQADLVHRQHMRALLRISEEYPERVREHPAAQKLIDAYLFCRSLKPRPVLGMPVTNKKRSLDEQEGDAGIANPSKSLRKDTTQTAHAAQSSISSNQLTNRLWQTEEEEQALETESPDVDLAEQEAELQRYAQLRRLSGKRQNALNEDNTGPYHLADPNPGPSHLINPIGLDKRLNFHTEPPSGIRRGFGHLDDFLAETVSPSGSPAANQQHTKLPMPAHQLQAVPQPVIPSFLTSPINMLGHTGQRNDQGGFNSASRPGISRPRVQQPINTQPDQQDVQALFSNIQGNTGTGATLPTFLTVTLYKHQEMALSWMRNMEADERKKGGILGDDMGLGKTVSTLALIVSNPAPHGQAKTTLIIGPLSLLKQWEREIAQKLKVEHRLSTYTYHGNHRNAYDILRRYDVVFTSYGTVASEYRKREKYITEMAKNGSPADDELMSTRICPLLSPKSFFHRIILDEAQNIKNAKSLQSRAARSLQSTYRWCLTGTPMMNRVTELAPILDFLRIRPYCGPKSVFDYHFGVLKPKATRRAPRDADKATAMRRLQAILKAIMLRRTKKSEIDGKPIIQLPHKSEEVVLVALSQEESVFYRKLEEEGRSIFQEMLRNGEIGARYAFFLVRLLRLRQASCHWILHLNELEVPEGEAQMAKMKRYANRLRAEAIARLSQSGEAYECSSCHDVIVDPRITVPCGHTLCSDCATSLTEEQDGEDAVRPQCSSCEAMINPKHIISYCAFRQVHMRHTLAADEDGLDDSDSDTERDDDGQGDDVDERGNLKDFVVDDDEEDLHDGADPDDDDDKDFASEGKAQQSHEGTELDDEDTKGFVLEDRAQLLHRQDWGRCEEKKDLMLEDKVRSSHDGDNHIPPIHVASEPDSTKAAPQPQAAIEPIHAKDPEVDADDSQVHTQNQHNEVHYQKLKRLRAASLGNPRSLDRYMRYLAKTVVPSSKITKCCELVSGFQATGEKTIVFSQFTLLLDIVNVTLQKQGITCRRYDGSLSAMKRDSNLNDFTSDPDVKVILVGLKAGNAGLNLTAASRIVIMDPFWNPYIEMQAVDRAYRIGQQREVKVYRLLVEGTIEQRIADLQDQKKAIVEAALDEEAAVAIGRLSHTELGYLFGIGA